MPSWLYLRNPHARSSEAVAAPTSAAKVHSELWLGCGFPAVSMHASLCMLVTRWIVVVLYNQGVAVPVIGTYNGTDEQSGSWTGAGL